MAKNRLDFRAQLSRHSHDLSAGYTASIAPGMIIPQWFDIAQPGDTYYLQSAMKARLQNIIRAFYGEIDLHLDYFFVPLQMLYTPFGQVFAQTDDFISSFIQPSNVGDADLGKFPTINIADSIASSGDDVSVVDFHGESYGKSLARLIDALDGNPLVVCSNAPEGVDHIDVDLCNMGNVSPWLFAAYQCIYQKYYRNPEFERLNVSSYNFDTAYASLTFADDAYLRLRYVQRPSDYFTNIRVSPISSGINKFKPSSNDSLETGGDLSDILCKVDSFLDSESNGLFYSTVDSKVTSAPPTPSLAFDSTSVLQAQTPYSNASYSLVSASNIRSLFALDKFARIYGRADKTYDDQILAHFGIEIPHDVKHDLTHIKHYHAVLGAKPVYGTANVPMFDGQSQNDIISTIGEVGGQGEVTLQSSDEKFTAPVHGVIMAVAYVVTKPRYTNTFSKLHWLDNRLKFPIPEFDKLGAQPMYLAEAHPWYIVSSGSSSALVRCGWQNRYAQFKQKYDRASLIYQNEPYTRFDGQNNLFAPWVIARSAYTELNSGTAQDSHMMDASMFFETPHALDMIMANPYHGEWSNSYFKNPHLMFQSDPLLTEFYMRCKKVSWMSETGEPDL